LLRRLANLIVLAAAAFRACLAGPLLNHADEDFWRQQARRIVDSARLDAGQASGKWRNQTRFTVHVPGGNMGYPAFWVRDAVMMLGADFIPEKEVEGWIRLIAATVSPADRPLRPGVLIPAWAVPDHINFNGLATFYPGSYDTGSEQGGKPWGKYPPLDDHFYFIHAVYEHWKMTGSLELFQSRVRISSGDIPLQDLCEKVYRVAPTDSQTGLCVTGDVEKENAKDFGFCDGESKSGKLLFPSLLKYVAATRLAELFRAVGQESKAAEYRQEATRIKAALVPTFFHRAAEPDEGWLHSATGAGNQPDVWGSAYALWSGAVEGRNAQPVARALLRAYREQTAVREGCVRQILTTDATNRGGWQISVSPVGEYQNGGYWGTPSGWYIAALWQADRNAAAAMARDYMRFLRIHLRGDGMTQAWEWFNPDTGRHANPLYVATVALPYLSLRHAGLLGDSRGGDRAAPQAEGPGELRNKASMARRQATTSEEASKLTSTHRTGSPAATGLHKRAPWASPIGRPPSRRESAARMRWPYTV